jgi:hypothetical protein
VRDVTYDEDRSQIRTGTGQQVMDALRNAAIGALRLNGVTNIAAANRHHTRDSTRPLACSGSSDDLPGPWRSAGIERTVSAFWRRGGWAGLLVGQGTSGGAGFRGRGELDGLPGDVRAGAALCEPVGNPGEEAR